MKLYFISNHLKYLLFGSLTVLTMTACSWLNSIYLINKSTHPVYIQIQFDPIINGKEYENELLEIDLNPNESTKFSIGLNMGLDKNEIKDYAKNIQSIRIKTHNKLLVINSKDSIANYLIKHKKKKQIEIIFR